MHYWRASGVFRGEAGAGGGNEAVVGQESGRRGEWDWDGEEKGGKE